MSERELNLALDTVDRDLCDTKYSKDLDEDNDEDITDETDRLFDELDEESVVEYKNDIDPDLIDDEEDTINFDDDNIYDEEI